MAFWNNTSVIENEKSNAVGSLCLLFFNYDCLFHELVKIFSFGTILLMVHCFHHISLSVITGDYTIVSMNTNSRII